ncbi:MAG: ferrochelatase [Planctomycetes bacterium]|nr:ferrochelatase [Planctomycetota bacterium]
MAKVALPLYPQFSWPSTGTALNVVYDFLKREGHHPDVTTYKSWHDDHGYINAQSDLILEFAVSNDLTHENTYLLFSTHGMPVSYIKRGDPYAEHVKRSVGLVTKRLGWPSDRTSLAYQSRLGPVKWLRPYTDHVLKELADAGEKNVLVCPISFTADCLETIEEIGIRYRELFEGQGGKLYLCPCLNTYRPFISALKHIVLSGPRPMTDHVSTATAERASPHAPSTVRDGLDSLVMIGASMRGRIDARRGPSVAHSDRDALHRVKRPQHEVVGMLQQFKEGLGLGDVWLWNTCHRFELFVRLSGAAKNRTHAVTRIREALFGTEEPAGLAVNELHGESAWHHLVRTAVGLNSGLPGERDVLEQLRASHRLASQAGTVGPFANGLVEDVLCLERRLRESTKWGEYHPEYAYAAMSRLISDLPFDLRDSRILVIGGSTTSASVLRTLTDRFQVPSRQLTLVYRGHKKGGQIKILRRAIGHGRRIRVQTYQDDAVAKAIHEADVVVFGVDHDAPILDVRRVADRRADQERPLTVFDFNVFGSTEGLESLPNVNLFDAARLEHEVTTFADDMCRASGFNEAVDEAEAWIVEHALSSRPGHDDGTAPVQIEKSARQSDVSGTVQAAQSSLRGEEVVVALGEEPSCQP